MSTDTITFDGGNGIRWTARLLTEGDQYGRSGALAWEHENRPGVEFYDTRYPHTEFGQFVGRYFVETLLEGNTANTGLNLDMGIPDWSIDKAGMDIVRKWLREQTAGPKLHAHVESRSRDCDGTYDRSYVTVIDDGEDEYDFEGRLLRSVVSTCGLGGKLEVTRFEEDDTFRLSWAEPTEEGFSNVEATTCRDECDEAATTFRDHTAEAAGY